MKKFILFLFLLLLVTTGFFAFLLRNDYEKISENHDAFTAILRTRVDQFVYTLAPRSVRLFLFTNMPGIFPVVMVCDHLNANGQKESFFSGDLIAATEDYHFSCPGGFEGSLQTGGQIRLLPHEGKPALQLLQGQLHMTFKETAPLIETEHLALSADGQPAGNRMAMAVSHDGTAVGCLNGVVKGSLELSPGAETKKNVVVVRDCFFSVKYSPTMPAKHLMPGDLLQYSDFEKSRQQWQPQDLPSSLSLLGLDPMANPALVARIDPVMASPDTVKLSWESPAPGGMYNCTLYTQENTRTPPQAAHRFQGVASMGDLVLLKGFLKFWISLSCSNGTQSLTSNILAPM